MPQLMPFFWMNSTLMIMFLLSSLLIFYFNKKLEILNILSSDSKELSFYMLW